jgi:Fe2+ transport system protein FeoA
MRVHVLLFDAGTDSEGIHSLEIAGRTVVLLFENPEDAERYAGLLEAQDFPVPTVEGLDREDVELFCRDAGYEARLIEAGFVPGTDEERLFMAPLNPTVMSANGRKINLRRKRHRPIPMHLSTRNQTLNSMR